MDKEIIELLKKMDSRLDSIDSRLNIMDMKLDEHSQILRALEHSSEVNKSEHDKMSNDIAHVSGNVESIKKDLTNVEIITSSNWNDIAKLKAVR